MAVKAKALLHRARWCDTWHSSPSSDVSNGIFVMANIAHAQPLPDHSKFDVSTYTWQELRVLYRYIQNSTVLKVGI
jgi:hypothetical protein